MKEKFTIEDTKIIKGLAIILMLTHHLWAFPDRLNGTLNSYFNIFGESINIYIGNFSKICVSLFFFLGGYGIYICSKERGFTILSRIKKLFISYWKVFLIFIPIGFIFFNNQELFSTSMYPRFNVFSIKEVFTNFLGMSSSLNGEWWFFQSYIWIVICFPLFKKVFEKFSTITNIFIVIIFSIFITNVFPALGNVPELGILNNNFLYRTFLTPTIYVSSFLMGIVFSKDNLLVKLSKIINDTIKLNFVYDILGIIIIIFLRQSVIGSCLDIIYVPIFIILILDTLKNLKYIRKGLEFLGKQSTNMWLIHSFFCYYYFFVSEIVICSKSPLLSLLILVAVSLISGIIVDYFWKFFGKLFKKIVNK